MEPHGRLLKKTAPDTTGRCTCGRRHCIQKSWAKPSNHTVSKTEPPNSLVHISTFEVIRLILGEATKLPLRLPEWLLEHAVPLSKLCVPIDFFYGLKHVMVIKHGNFHQTFCGLGFTRRKTRRAATLPVELFEWWPCATTTAFCARWAWVGWGFGPMKDK